MKRRNPYRGQIQPFSLPRGPAMRSLEETRLFRAQHGELCAHLAPNWHELLVSTQGLGPLALITHNPNLRLATMVKAIDFQPEPESSRFIELESGLVVDTSDWHYAIAVEENFADGATFGFQFFDHSGAGQLKLMLTEKTQLKRFISIANAYGIGGYPPQPKEPSPTPSATQSIPPDREFLRALWPTTRHELNDSHFPGLPGVTRLCALQHVGEDLALRLSPDAMLLSLLFARKHSLPLKVTLFNSNLVHRTTLVPRSLERCPHGTHLFDRNAECHLFSQNLLYWAIQSRERVAIELITSQGCRVGMIEGIGTDDQQLAWADVISSTKVD